MKFTSTTQSKPLTQTYSIKQQVAIFAVVGVAMLLFVEPSMAQALAPVTRSSGIVRDTIVGICLALMTAAWGYAGMKMSFSGASMRDMQGPLLGGTISGGAAAMAAAFIA